MQTNLEEHVILRGFHFPSTVIGSEPCLSLTLLAQAFCDTKDVSKIGVVIERLKVRIANNALEVQMCSSSSQPCSQMIRKSDAERLLGMLPNKLNSIAQEQEVRELRIPVSHELFEERTTGWANISRQHGRRIQCRECNSWFNPEDFAVHNHSPECEGDGTVHWGLDCSKWRLFIILDYGMCQIDQQIQAEWERFLSTEEFKRVEEKPRRQKRKVKCVSRQKVKRIIEMEPQSHGLPLTIPLSILQKESEFKRRALFEALCGLLPPIDPSRMQFSCQAVLRTQPRIVHPICFNLPKQQPNNLTTMQNIVSQLEALTLEINDARSFQLVQRLRTLLYHMVAEDILRSSNHGTLFQSYSSLFDTWQSLHQPPPASPTKQFPS